MSDVNEAVLSEIATLRSRGLTPKAIARELALRPADVTNIIRQQAAQSPAITDPGLKPLVACLVNAGWKQGLILDEQAAHWPAASEGEDLDTQGLVMVLVAREHRYDKVMAAAFLVDVFCLGVKNAYPARMYTHAELVAFQRMAFSRIGAPVSVPIEVAQNLVLGAVEYARGLGFAPHPDFARGRTLLGEWNDVSHIRFGREGKPLFVNGPDDDVPTVLAKLNHSVGQGNYDFMIGDGSP